MNTTDAENKFSQQLTELVNLYREDADIFITYAQIIGVLEVQKHLLFLELLEKNANEANFTRNCNA